MAVLELELAGSAGPTRSRFVAGLASGRTGVVRIQRPTIERVASTALPVLRKPPPDHPAQLELMRLLEQRHECSQRELASGLVVSLGKTHYVLKALFEKGWVKAQNFKRSSHKMGYLYVLTPRGVSQRLQLPRSFLASKEQDYELLQAEIAALRKELAQPHTRA